MRRRVMVLTLALPLAAYSLVAGAQTTPKGKGAAAASAAPAASASAAPPADTSASAAPAASTAPATGGAGTPAPVMVDMNSKPADQAMNGATYSVRLRDLEQRVDELKDQIRRNASPRHVPAKVIAVTDIPHTRSGKIVRRAIREDVPSKQR